MAQALYEWMQDLACYFILLSAVMNFLPDNSYKKYIQYYMGLLLLLVALSPIFQAAGIQEEIQTSIEKLQEPEEDRALWEERARQWEVQWQEQFQVPEEEVNP